jgi:RND family efflux transporter MFP subunit
MDGWMQGRTAWLRALSCAAMLAITAFGAYAAEATGPDVPIALEERQLRAAGIELGQPEPEAGSSAVQFPGTVAVPPQQLRVVAAPAGGLVEAVQVAPFQQVRAGQPVARLRSPDLLEAQRAYLQALAAERLARTKLARDEQMAKERIIAERRLWTTRADHEFAQTTLEEREQFLGLLGMPPEAVAALREQRRMAAVLDIIAPEDAVVLSISVNPGERVAPATALVTMAKLEPLWLNLQVPLSVAAAIEPGTAVAVMGSAARGRVMRVGRNVDSATQAVTVVAEVDTAAQLLRPGQVVSASAAVRPNGTPQWQVPVGAVVRHAGRSWVFVRQEEGFVARPVMVVAESAQGASIRAALAPGDKVAVRGVLFLLGELATQYEG